MGRGPGGLTWQREQQQQQRPAAERRHSAGRGWHAPPAAPHTGQRARGGDCGRTERPRRARPGPTLGISSPLAFGEKRGEGQGWPEEGGRAGAGRGGPQGGGRGGQCGGAGGGRAGRRRVRGLRRHRGPARPLPNGTGTRRQLRRPPGRLWYLAGGLSLPAAAGVPAMPSPGTPGSPGTPHGSPAWRASATRALDAARRYRRAVQSPEHRTRGGAGHWAWHCPGQVQHCPGVPEHPHTQIKLAFPHTQTLT